MFDERVLEAKPPFSKYLDHTVLNPASTEADFAAGCDLAAAYDTAAFCVPSYMVQTVARRLRDTSVLTCSVAGFPHGNVHPAVKLHEAIRAVEDGAAEVDMVVNVGLVKSAAWTEVEREIDEINDAVNARRALLKVIFETCYLSDAQIISLCEIATRVGVAFVKTSTGFGTAGATLHHVSLMRAHVPGTVGIKAAGGIRTRVDAERFLLAGATRIGTSATATILDAAYDSK